MTNAEIASEKDPNGKDPHSPGAKLDEGKTRLHLMASDFPYALWEIARVATYGAEKYTEHGWHSVPDGIERYSEAMMRHYFQHVAGNSVDAESNLSHLAHMAWNALAVLQLTLEQNRD